MLASICGGVISALLCDIMGYCMMTLIYTGIIIALGLMIF